MFSTSLNVIISSSLILFAVLTSGAVTSPGVRRQRSDDGGPLEVVVQHLSQQLSSLRAQLTQQDNTFNAQLTEQAAQIAALKSKTETLDRTVAFHAWGSTNPVQATAHGNIVLNHAATNIGNAYDTLTGVFTVPVSGLYDFQACILGHEVGSDQYVHGAIYVDNVIQAEGISDNRHGYYGATTFTAVVHVNKGQKVFVKNTDNKVNLYADDRVNPFTTFSGFLIRAD